MHLFFKCITLTIFSILCYPHETSGIQRADRQLFQFPLSTDSNSLYYTNKNASVLKSLSGPVIMENNTLLFYCRHGYVLFDTEGKKLETYNLHEQNKRLDPSDPKRLVLAYPVSLNEVLVYHETADEKKPPVVFSKRLFKRRLTKLRDNEANQYKRVKKALLYNMAHNVITDEMSPRIYLKPHLVGFVRTSDILAEQWWGIDRFYSFASPVLHVNSRGEYSFFRGIVPMGHEKRNIRQLSLDMLGTFLRQGRRYYIGLFSGMGSSRDRYNQKLFFCDNAGNVLYSDSLLKEEKYIEVLGKDADPNKNLFYTTKATRLFVFPPAVDHDGTLYYGVVNYEDLTLTCFSRIYSYYVPHKTSQDLAHLLDMEQLISWKPVHIPCSNPQQTMGSRIPHIILTDIHGNTRKAQSRDITVKEYVVRISRVVHRDIDRKLSRRQPSFGVELNTGCDSLLQKSTTSCPYTISISGPRGMLTSYHYAAGETVHSARVLQVRDRGDILIRVDLEQYAEVLIVDLEGNFINRFTFNRQYYTDRRDVITASQRSDIVELDFEGGNRGAYVRWEEKVL